MTGRVQLYWIVPLRGLRRGDDPCGLSRDDLDPATGHAKVAQTVLQLGGRIVIDALKPKARHPMASLDAETGKLLKAPAAPSGASGSTTPLPPSADHGPARGPVTGAVFRRLGQLMMVLHSPWLRPPAPPRVSS